MLFFGDASEVLTPGAIHFLVLIALFAWIFRRTAPARNLLAIVFIWAWIFSTPAIGNLALAQLEGVPRPIAAPTTGEPLYIVMGSGTPANAHHGGRAQLTLAGWRRTKTAVEHWRVTGGKLAFIGGQGATGDPAQTSIAAAMARLARESGVPAQAITAAGHQTLNSRDDLIIAKSIVAAQQSPAYLVTSAAHMPRTLGVAKKLGLEVAPLPCDWRQLHTPSWRAWLPNAGGPRLWQAPLYELLGSIAYRWRGWI